MILPDPEKTEETVVDPAEEARQLRAELAEAKARGKVFEDTLKALQPVRSEDTGPPTSYDYQTPPIEASVRQRIKQRLGWDDATVDSHWQIIGTFFSEIGRPVIGAVAELADRSDWTKARLTKADYAEIEKDVEDEYKKRLREGRPASRSDIYEAVRSRPEWRQKDMEKELAKREADSKARTAASKAAETEGATSGGVAPARPTQVTAKASDKDMTAEKFASMSLEDKEAWLEGKTF